MKLRSRGNGQHWVIEPPEQSFDNAISRVSAVIDGAPLWFESSDTELTAAPEAFASLLFVPALFSDSRVTSAAALDSVWLDNTRNLLPIFQSWWQTGPEYPIEAEEHSGSALAPQQRGLCYSGGVDSLYEYINAENDIDYLVFVHGFDIDVDDRARMDACETALRQLEQSVGKKVIIVRTNARKHPVFGRFDWERTHGAALAAVGHALGKQVGRLRVAASWSYPADQPWGSHWDTDPLWSSGIMQIEHADATLTRQEKIKRIADHPLAHQYLRVCWENLSSSGNCCRCAKCVRTMLSFHVCGTLQKFTCFPDRDKLRERLDDIPYLSKALHGPAREQLNELKDPELHAAMARLLERRRPRGLRRWLSR